MISVTNFNAICTQLVQMTGIQGHVLVAHEGHAVNKLKDRKGIWLVAVMPSAQREGRPDAGVDSNTAYLFVLEKDISGQSDPKELDQYQRTQDVILKIRGYIEQQYSNGCSPFARYQPNSAHIDPEYREFGGWNGWSMTVTF